MSIQRAFATLGTPGVALERVIEIAVQHGCEGIELRAATDDFVHPGLDVAERRILQSKLKGAGVRAISLSSYIRLGTEDVLSQVQELLLYLELAADLDSGGVRTFLGHNDTAAPDPVIHTRALEVLASVAPRCAELGVWPLIETHGLFYRSAQNLGNFMAAVDSSIPGHEVGVVWDTAHTWVAGEELKPSFDAIRPWLAHLQIRDIVSRADPSPTSPGAGSFPIEELGTLLTAAHFCGWASLEWERRWHPELPPVEEALPHAWEWASLLLTGQARPQRLVP